MSQVQQPSLSREINRPRTNRNTYLKRYWTLYLLLALPIAFFVIFRYIPMAYILMAFKKKQYYPAAVVCGLGEGQRIRVVYQGVQGPALPPLIGKHHQAEPAGPHMRLPGPDPDGAGAE